MSSRLDITCFSFLLKILFSSRRCASHSMWSFRDGAMTESQTWWLEGRIIEGMNERKQGMSRFIKKMTDCLNSVCSLIDLGLKRKKEIMKEILFIVCVVFFVSSQKHQNRTVKKLSLRVEAWMSHVTGQLIKYNSTNISHQRDYAIPSLLRPPKSCLRFWCPFSSRQL